MRFQFLLVRSPKRGVPRTQLNISPGLTLWFDGLVESRTIPECLSHLQSMGENEKVKIRKSENLPSGMRVSVRIITDGKRAAQFVLASLPEFWAL